MNDAEKLKKRLDELILQRERFIENNSYKHMTHDLHRNELIEHMATRWKEYYEKYRYDPKGLIKEFEHFSPTVFENEAGEWIPLDEEKEMQEWEQGLWKPVLKATNGSNGHVVDFEPNRYFVFKYMGFIAENIDGTWVLLSQNKTFQDDRIYLQVRLQDNSTNKRDSLFYAHRIVAESYCGYDMSSGKIVDHKDNVQTNNNAQNLRMVTHGENKSYSLNEQPAYHKGEADRLNNDRLTMYYDRLQEIDLKIAEIKDRITILGVSTT